MEEALVVYFSIGSSEACELFIAYALMLNTRSSKHLGAVVYSLMKRSQKP